jgi:RNase P protein component
MCTNIATTQEHVPPKCLFPEKKDIGENKYRFDLITVPSCEEHNNNKKSDDDEFLMVSIAGILGNNSIGYIHSQTKVKRALRRNAYKLLKKVFLKSKNLKLEVKNNQFVDVIIGTPDVLRLKKSFEHIAYGIYYHHFNKYFDGTVRTFMGFLDYSEQNGKNFKDIIRDRTSIELKNKEKFGKNQDIFYYQFLDKDEHGLLGLKLCFYEGVDVYVVFSVNEFELSGNIYLMNELINDGMKVIIKEEKKTYNFN